jgi:hypothetical protein
MQYSSRKTKKFLLEYEILSMELEDSKKIYNECEKKFLAEVRSYVKEKNLNIKKRSETEETKKEQKEQKDIACDNSKHDDDGKYISNSTKQNISAALKKIYKKIALKTHPDKIINNNNEEKEKLLSLYKDAQNALEESNMPELLKIANNLNIEIGEIEEEDLSSIKKTLLEMKDDILLCQSKYPWVWHHASDETEKERCIEEFISVNIDNLDRIIY